ncbi:MAG TPA: methyltransferase, partial [Candidatus Limnocylindria bacterium]|nr:methyltransferase [Candidatus Limnocylindria bacterium]
EVGGGVGALGIELLRAGAARVVNVELSPAYEDEALALLRERRLEERVERRVADAAAGELPQADVVVLHKVVCCYPDAAALVAASARSARRALALTFPRDTWWVRAVIRAIDVVLALRRRAYRAYAHSAALVLGAATGMRVVHDAEDLVWRCVVLER